MLDTLQDMVTYLASRASRALRMWAEMIDLNLFTKPGSTGLESKPGWPQDSLQIFRITLITCRSKL